MDITIIEIKESDLNDIIKDIDYLYYDLNYKNGYEQYLNMNIFTLQYPRGEETYANGKIIEIINNNNKYGFLHNIKTDYGASGCPIIIPYTLKVIGIHRGGDLSKKINYGSFIGEILNETENELNKKNKDKIKRKNYIIGEIYISKEDIGKEILIINSYENVMRNLNNSLEGYSKCYLYEFYVPSLFFFNKFKLIKF